MVYLKDVTLIYILTVINIVLCSANFYSHSVTSITGEKIDLSKYRGKVSLVVNVASACGYTDGHYKALVRLQDQFKHNDKFNILAFPCNQFGAQEPMANKDILKFARDTYQVNFPMFEKINVLESNVPAAWQYLIGAAGQAPTWNFWKYLVDHEGNFVEAWGPWTEVHAAHATIYKAVDKAVAADLISKNQENHIKHEREDL